MNTVMLRARQMSLALLIIAVVDHGHLLPNYSGEKPQSSGLLRLGRDLMRRAGIETTDEVIVAERTAPRAR
jgi:hypothetical protein